MVKRWIIRGLFMLPLLIVVVGWGWSSRHSGSIEYAHHGQYVRCGTEWGGVFIVSGNRTRNTDGWEFSTIRLRSFDLLPPRFTVVYYFLGFGLHSPIGTAEKLLVPYWFLLLLIGTILFLVWRKTRPTIHRAFQVEIRASRE
jgi:hypothetical protein